MWLRGPRPPPGPAPPRAGEPPDRRRPRSRGARLRAAPRCPCRCRDRGPARRAAARPARPRRPPPAPAGRPCARSGPRPSRCSPHELPSEEEDAGGVLEAVARVVLERGELDLERAGAVVADEEDRAAALARVVAGHPRAGDQDAEVVAVRVDRAARAAAWSASPLRVGAAA